jgi:putative oxidoreductase
MSERQYGDEDQVRGALGFLQSCKSTDVGLLILRVAAGGLMLTHGWPKFQQVLSGAPFQDGFMWADPIGVGPGLSLILAASAEFLAAAMIVLGLLTRAATLPLIVTMVVASLVVHGGMASAAAELAATSTDPEVIKAQLEEATLQRQKMELPLLYALAYLTLLFTGAGRISLDWKLKGKIFRSVR